MGAITSLEQRSIEVPPGGEATCAVLLRNDATVVDQFTVEVLGDAQTWARVDPATVNLLPNEETTVVIRFAPPRSSDVPAGVVPFGVRVSSREDPRGSVVEEGNVDVGVFTDVRVELVPRKARGRRQGRCDVVVDNLGNHPVALGIDADDPERSLRFHPEHTDLTLQPGTTAFVGLTMRPERGFLRGPERTHPFQVRVAGSGVPATTAEGAMVQEPLLPKWLPIALAALLAALIALAILWYTVLKPTIRSSAQEAAEAQVQDVANTANQAKNRAEQAAQALNLPPLEEQPAEPGKENEAPGASATPTPTETPGAPGPGAPGALVREPIDFRIAPPAPGAQTPPGSNDFTFAPFELPEEQAGRTLLISDLLLQNPFGDGGILRILRVEGTQPLAEGEVLLEVGLGNFRDLDYHFLQPWRFQPDEKVVLAVLCQNPLPEPAGDPAPCNPSASFSGQLEGPPPPSTTSAPATPGNANEPPG